MEKYIVSNCELIINYVFDKQSIVFGLLG